MMRHLALATSVLALSLGLASPTHADTVTVGDWVNFDDAPGANAAGGGGAFTVSVVGTAESWITFCLEATETMNYADNFYVAGISTRAFGGGSGVDPAVGDPLDDGTRAIYHKFRNGNGENWSGADVQYAIWYLEGEKAQMLGGSSALITWANANAASYDFGNQAVWVMNLRTAAGGPAQDQLFLRPVPEPATVALTGLALGVLLRRRRHAPRA